MPLQTPFKKNGIFLGKSARRVVLGIFCWRESLVAVFGTERSWWNRGRIEADSEVIIRFHFWLKTEILDAEILKGK